MTTQENETAVADGGTLPEVKAGTKFRRGGFKSVAQVQEEQQAKGKSAAPEGTPPDEDREMMAAIAADPHVTHETQEGVAPIIAHAQEAESPEEGEAAAAEAAPAAEPAKFRIGGKDFQTQEEAWAYAEQLEQEKIAADAFRQGVEAASRQAPGNQPAAPAEPEAPREIDPEYYTDPAGYFAKREAEIISKAKAAVDRDLQLRDSHKRTWEKFYQDYPDLSEAREFVEFTMQKNWDTLQHIELNQALKQLAEKTRKALEPVIKAKMPKVELPKVKQATAPSGAQGVTTEKAKPQALSFTQQLRQNRRGRAQAR